MVQLKEDRSETVIKGSHTFGDNVDSFCRNPGGEAYFVSLPPFALYSPRNNKHLREGSSVDS